MGDTPQPTLQAVTAVCHLKQGEAPPITVRGSHQTGKRWRITFTVPTQQIRLTNFTVKPVPLSGNKNFRAIREILVTDGQLQILELIKQALPHHTVIPSWAYGVNDSEQKVIITTELPESEKVFNAVIGGPEAFIGLPGIEDERLYDLGGHLLLAKKCVVVAVGIIDPPLDLGQESQFGIHIKLPAWALKPKDKYDAFAEIAAVCLRQT